MSEKAVTTDTTPPDSAPRRVRPGTLLAALAVVLFASLVIFRDLADEPFFIDESAMIAQSYYYTLMKTGQRNHPDWLHYAAYDHPPLPKYLFGLSLDLAGLPVPQNLDRWMAWMGYTRDEGRWVKSPTGNDFSPPSEPGVLYWARVPAAIFGIGGALATFFVGLQVHRRLVGVAAALLLSVNPLYLAHARRAMSDSFTECLVIAAVAMGLCGTQELWESRCRVRRWLVFVVAESVLCGLAALAKLNGGVAAVMVVAMLIVATLLAWLARHLGKEARVRPITWNLVVGPIVAIAVGAGSFLVFLLLNPVLTARPRLSADADPELRKIAAKDPIRRALYLVTFRREWAQDAMRTTQFQRDWLRTTPERLRMTLWEGFGRYSVLGNRKIWPPEPRPLVEGFWDYRRSSSLVWFPLVVWGFICAFRDGLRAFRAGQAPTAWGLVLYSLAAAAIVVLLIPLNWDRYYLPLQACSSLLVPYGIAGTLRWMGSRVMLKPAVP